jgi:hypothetical protein
MTIPPTTTRSSSPREHRPHALPIVVGVTGHRHLATEHVAPLASAVAAIFAGLRREYPASPITLLSPLAEGADQLVARVALEAGAALLVPLPFAPELYERDFSTDDGRCEFRRLLERADSWFVLPPIGDAGHDDLRDDGPVRDHHYAQVGAYVARSSQILIALWDGVERDLRGGTSQVVAYRLDGPPREFAPASSPLDPPLNGPVYHVLTPSHQHPTPPGTLFATSVVFPSGFASGLHARETFTRVLGRIELFNRDERALGDRLADARRRSIATLVGDDGVAAGASPIARILEHYGVADAFAIHFQKRSLMALRITVFGVFVAVVFFEIYAHIAPDRHWLLGTYLGILLVTWLYSLAVRRSDFQSKHLDYRALAEGLRVQYFWAAAGLRENVADYYMRKQRTILDWIREAIQTWTLPSAPVIARDSDVRAEGLRHAATQWVDDQARYYRRSASRLHGNLHRLERVTDVLFGTALTVAVVQLALHRLLHDALHLGHLPLLAIGLLLLSAGVLHGYTGRRGLSELSQQFERMTSLHTFALRRLDRLIATEDLAGATELVRELGIEALEENGDWLLIHRQRPIEVSKGH